MSIDFDNLDRAVFFTLCYSDLFNFPLTFKEIQRRLPKVWDWDFLTGRLLVSYKLILPRQTKNVQSSLEKLIRKKLLGSKTIGQTSYYYLINHPEVLHQRFVRRQYLPAREKALADLLKLLRFFPSIRAVILTGSSAVKNAQLSDDLDFCLITSRNTLWISRFFLILLAKFLNKQVQIDASAKKNSHQAWCFNMWLDKSNLNVIHRRFSIYQAYEVMQMQWVLDKDQLQQQFAFANQQLGDLLPALEFTDVKPPIRQNSPSIIFWPINLFFFYLQIIYRQLMFSTEHFFLSLHQAYFNDNYRQQKYFRRIKKKMLDAGIFAD